MLKYILFSPANIWWNRCLKLVPSILQSILWPSLRCLSSRQTLRTGPVLIEITVRQNLTHLQLNRKHFCMSLKVLIEFTRTWSFVHRDGANKKTFKEDSTSQEVGLQIANIKAVILACNWRSVREKMYV